MLGSAQNHLQEPAGPADYSIPGFRVQRRFGRGQWPLSVRTAEPQPDWLAHRPAPLSEPTHPETAIRYAGEVYRIEQVDAMPDGGSLYRLVYWPRGESIRGLAELSPEGIARARAERKYLARMTRFMNLAPWYEWLFGFLPIHIQEWLAGHWYFSPDVASSRNGMAQVFVGWGVCYLGSTAILRDEIKLGCGLGLLALALGVDGGLRCLHTSFGHEPSGMVVLEVIDRLVRWCWRRRPRLRAAR